MLRLVDEGRFQYGFSRKQRAAGPHGTCDLRDAQIGRTAIAARDLPIVDVKRRGGTLEESGRVLDHLRAQPLRCPQHGIGAHDCAAGGECAASERNEIGIAETNRNAVERHAERLRADLRVGGELTLALGRHP